MRLSPNQKKWIRRIGWLIGIRLVLGLILYIIITYHFKELIAFAIKKETKHSYHFTAQNIDVAIFNERINIQDAVIYCVDSLQHPAAVHITIPSLSLHLKSISKLIFHKELLIDSLAIHQLKIRTTAPEGDTALQPIHHLHTIIQKFKRLKAHLNINQLELKDASIEYETSEKNNVFAVNGIQFFIDNGFGLNSPASIEADLSAQDWSFSAHHKRIRFQKLEYKNKELKIDSFELYGMKDSLANSYCSAERLLAINPSIASAHRLIEFKMDSLMVRGASGEWPANLNLSWKAKDSMLFSCTIRHIVKDSAE